MLAAGGGHASTSQQVGIAWLSAQAAGCAHEALADVCYLRIECKRSHSRIVNSRVQSPQIVPRNMDLTEDGVEVPAPLDSVVSDNIPRTHAIISSKDSMELAVSSDARAPGAVSGKGIGRPDKTRGMHALRPMACEQGIIHRADGSARMCVGDTVVIAGVYGPRGVRGGKVGSDVDAPLVAVAFSGATLSAGTLADREMEVIVQNIVMGAIVASVSPRTEVSVIVQIVHDAGSVLPCAINAVCLALMDAAIPLHYMFAGLTCGSLGNMSVDQLLMDVTQAEAKV
jgi:exosome complex component RRP46